MLPVFCQLKCLYGYVLDKPMPSALQSQTGSGNRVEGAETVKHDNLTTESDFFGKEKISRILIQIAPLVMLAQLIQALYNILDSFFVGRYSANALTALSVIYPLQFIIVALAVGTGVGLNTYMAREYAQENAKAADAAAGTGTVLALATWALFAAVSALLMGPYVRTSATSPEAIADVW